MLMLESRLGVGHAARGRRSGPPTGTRRVGEIVGERCGERSLPARRRLLSEPEAAIEAPLRGDEPLFSRRRREGDPAASLPSER